MKKTMRRLSRAFTGTIGLVILLSTSSLLAQSIDLSGRTDRDSKRDATRKPVEIIKFSGVKSGDNILDLLAGGGYYSEILSRVVGDKGGVTLQIPKAYLNFVGDVLTQRLANNRLKNVTYLLSEAPDLKLGKEQYDSAYLVLGYHDMFFKNKGWDFDADTVIPQVHTSLKAGGKLLVVDHDTATGNGTKDCNKLHRIESTFTKTDLEKRGFRLVKQSDLLKNTADDYNLSVFDKKIRGKTDRFVMLFEKI